MSRRLFALLAVAFWIDALFAGQNLPEPVLLAYKTVQGETLNLHMFSPGDRGTSPRAAAILLHGGGWVAGEARWTYGPAREYTARGVIAFAVDYRLSDRKAITPPDAVEDTRDAIRWVRSQANRLNVDPQRIIAHGVSAGGHLAVLAAESEAAVAPNALVLWSPGVAATEDPFFRSLVGDPSRVTALSPLDQVRRGMAPAIVISGARDVVTPDEGARRFCAKVNEVGTRCDVHTFDGLGHLLSRKLDPKAQYGGDFDFDPQATASAQAAVWRFLEELGYLKR